MTADWDYSYKLTDDTRMALWMILEIINTVLEDADEEA